MQEQTKYLTIRQISEHLQIKSSTLYAWVTQGKIPFVRIHRLIRFRQEEIDRWLESFNQEMRTTFTRFQSRDHRDIDILVARAKREVYNTPRGEARPEGATQKACFLGTPESAQRKEKRNGAV